MPEQPYNPLDKRHLAESVANALLGRAIYPLPPPEPFVGAGIYAIYYIGNFPSYGRIAEPNREGRSEAPIYIGKAVPPGAQKGEYGLGEAPFPCAWWNRFATFRTGSSLSTHVIPTTIS